MSELKPCPFCGHKAVQCNDDGYGGCHIGCDNGDCECDSGIILLAGQLEKARELWNTRAKPHMPSDDALWNFLKSIDGLATSSEFIKVKEALKQFAGME